MGCSAPLYCAVRTRKASAFRTHTVILHPGTTCRSPSQCRHRGNLEQKSAFEGPLRRSRPARRTANPARLAQGPLGLVPNEDSVVEAARGCALIGDGLAPRLVTAHELGRTEMGNMWVRYTFQCEFGSEPSTAVD